MLAEDAAADGRAVLARLTLLVLAEPVAEQGCRDGGKGELSPS